jgi:hypothetical protein
LNHSEWHWIFDCPNFEKLLQGFSAEVAEKFDDGPPWFNVMDELPAV